MTSVPAYEPSLPLVLHTRPVIDLSPEQFYEFCLINHEWRIERTAEGDLRIMALAGGGTGSRNTIITLMLTTWALQDGTGVAFDSSTGFTLPNGATRSPDAAWVQRARLAVLTADQKEKFLPLCPDFVLELRSPSDDLGSVQEKMQEYLDNGARLGWLIDPSARQVYVYRPSVTAERVDDPPSVCGDPELPGFVLELTPIWEPPF